MNKGVAMTFSIGNSLYSGLSSRLSGGVGNDEDNNEQDVKTARENLNKAGYEAGDNGSGILDRDLDTATKSFQRDNGLKIDGIIRPNGETEQALNTIVKRKTGQSKEVKGKDNNFFPEMPKSLKLQSSIGDGRENKVEDIGLLENILAGLGHLPIGELNNGKGTIRPSIIKATKDFQKKNGLFVDGVIKPDGEMQEALNKVLMPFILEDRTDPEGAKKRKKEEEREKRKRRREPWDDLPDDSGDSEVSEADKETVESSDEEKNEPTLMGSPELDEQLIDNIISEEDMYKYLYKDSKGQITIGAGTLVDSPEKMKSLPMYVKDENGKKRPATDEEKVEAYEAIESFKKGEFKDTTADKYNPKDHPELRNIFIETDVSKRLVKEHLLEDYKKLKADLKKSQIDFDKLDDDIKMAIFDIRYNTGNFQEENLGNGDRSWPNLIKAIREDDWGTAMQETRRGDVGDDRNSRTRVPFERKYFEKNPERIRKQKPKLSEQELAKE